MQQHSTQQHTTQHTMQQHTTQNTTTCNNIQHNNLPQHATTYNTPHAMQQHCTLATVNKSNNDSNILHMQTTPMLPPPQLQQQRFFTHNSFAQIHRWVILFLQLEGSQCRYEDILLKELDRRKEIVVAEGAMLKKLRGHGFMPQRHVRGGGDLQSCWEGWTLLHPPSTVVRSGCGVEVVACCGILCCMLLHGVVDCCVECWHIVLSVEA